MGKLEDTGALNHQDLRKARKIVPGELVRNPYEALLKFPAVQKYVKVITPLVYPDGSLPVPTPSSESYDQLLSASRDFINTLIENASQIFNIADNRGGNDITQIKNIYNLYAGQELIEEAYEIYKKYIPTKKQRGLSSLLHLFRKSGKR